MGNSPPRHCEVLSNPRLYRADRNVGICRYLSVFSPPHHHTSLRGTKHSPTVQSRSKCRYLSVFVGISKAQALCHFDCKEKSSTTDKYPVYLNKAEDFSLSFEMTSV